MPTTPPVRLTARYTRVSVWWSLLVLVTTTLAAAQTSYTLTTFDLLPEDVNKFGTVCGQYQGLPGRWKPGWAVPQVFPGAIYPGSCTDVNNYDQYVGYDQAPDQRGFWYLGSASTNTLTRLKAPSNASFTHGGHLNDSREIVG